MIRVGLLVLYLSNPMGEVRASSTPGVQVNVSRESVLDVAKELHPPGCTDSMTADYCMLYSAFDLREEIRGMLAQGMNKQQVIDELVQKYGERILAAPPTKGFHWLAWLIPGAAVTAGGVLIGSFVYVWVRRSADRSAVSKEREDGTVSEEKQRQVQEELKQWL